MPVKDRMPSSSSNKACALTLLVVAVLVGCFFLFAPYYSTHLWWIFRSMWFWFIPLIGLIVIAAIASVLLEEGTAGTLVLLTIAGGLGLIGWLFVYNYAQDAVYAESIQVTEDPAPTLNLRVPYSVSAAQVRSNLGDIPGDTQATMYVPDDETFATLVEQRGFTTGYQTLLEQEISTRVQHL